ncbi:MAG TPA: tetratricopeptide repeat protein [Candidatus Acidoferrum sp.]|nr:tetratricopeptide repeat protein [Candidatus Acidoferrum sp.]
MMNDESDSNRSGLFCSALVLLLLLASVCTAQTDSEYRRAVAAFRAGDYVSAADLFAKADAAAPGVTNAPIYRAKALVHLQDFAGAERELHQYLALHTDSDEALYLLGFVLHRESKVSESLEIYTKAAALKTPTGEDLKIVGLDYVLLNDYADAIKWLEKAVELDSKNKDAWYYLGRAYYSRSLLPKSRRAFQTVLDLDQRDARAENNIGLILESEAKPNEALEAYRKAIEWQEGSAHQSEQPYLNLGNLLLELDRAGEAVAPLEKAVELGANDASCHLKLGTAYLRTNRLPEAQRELEKAARLEPENAAIHYQLARFYKQIHQMDKAKIEFQRTEELQSRAAKTPPSNPPEL